MMSDAAPFWGEEPVMLLCGEWSCSVGCFGIGEQVREKGGRGAVVFMRKR